MSNVHVVILAAGSGIRMKSGIPKVLHPICGRPMIAYALDLAAACGVKQPIVVLGPQAEQVKPHLPKEVKVVIQSRPLGTGDAVLMAKRAVGGFTGNLVILYADTPLLRRTTIQRLIETHRKSNATCTLLTTHLADPSGYGRVVRDATGLISGVVEEVEANAQQRAIREINVGPLCASAPALFTALSGVHPGQVGKEWYLTQAIGLLAKQEGTKFQTLRLEKVEEALGVNSRVELAKAADIIRRRIIDSHLANGVTIVDPRVTYIDHGVSIGHDSVIHPGTVIESGVSIGKRCSVGPFTRLRSGVAIADDVRIGNFVELVRTKVGQHVRINHVTYLGDTTVEDEVNIGAGTITANFDGTNKLPTTIGKGAFIGCDTVLIAPVKVGPGAVTGAGSVVPKGHDVPARGVVVGVPARLLDGKAVVRREPSKPSAAPRTPAASASRAPKPRVVKAKTTVKTPRSKRSSKPVVRRPSRPKAKTRRPKRRAAPARRARRRSRNR